jgi:L-ascorbate metabolism protein UlaG (beta-lactamase superfamily)
MNITWCGTASILVENQDTKLIFDPFMKMDSANRTTPPSLLKQRLQTFRNIDAILITHGHYDHIGHIRQIYCSNGVTIPAIYCTQTPAARLIKEGIPKNQIHIIKPGDTFPLGTLQIQVYQGRHIRFDRKLILNTFLNREILKHFPDTLKLLQAHLIY